MNIDEKYMRQALNLARRAEGLTSPNPIVGAVIVKNGRVVGKGYHKACGLPHAEINALKTAGKKAGGAALYVTLEPCNHYGRTPPCTDAIIDSGIKRVIVGMKDPNPLNNGRGIKRLKRAGIWILTGILERESAALNAPFIKFITTGLPYVTVKMAQSLDGKIATASGQSRWITSEESRRYVHKLRGRVDAVMVGANTVIKDDPLLLSKAKVKKQPARIIVGGESRIPRTARIFSRTDESPVIIATAEKSGKRVDLKYLLKILAKMGMINILVEGGGELAAGLVERNLADRFLFFIAPRIIGGRTAPTSVEGDGVLKLNRAPALKNISIKRFTDDILIEGEVSRCSQA